jgi:hypothetical protein
MIGQLNVKNLTMPILLGLATIGQCRNQALCQNQKKMTAKWRRTTSVIFVPHVTTKGNFNTKSDYPKVSNVLACLSEIPVGGRLIYFLENWKKK